MYWFPSAWEYLPLQILSDLYSSTAADRISSTVCWSNLSLVGEQLTLNYMWSFQSIFAYKLCGNSNPRSGPSGIKTLDCKFDMPLAPPDYLYFSVFNFTLISILGSRQHQHTGRRLGGAHATEEHPHSHRTSKCGAPSQHTIEPAMLILTPPPEHMYNRANSLTLANSFFSTELT